MTSSNHLVDPELKAHLECNPTRDLSSELLPGVRALFTPSVPGEAKHSALSVTSVTIEAGASSPSVRMLVYRPVRPKVLGPALLHIHGGGYVLGNPEMAHAQSRALAIELACVIVSVDYRLAPETPFPGALEDCHAALVWLFKNAAALGVDTGRIGVKGESAGGGLAAALCLLTRDRGEFMPAFQHLSAPMIDDRTCVHQDPPSFAGEFQWTRASNQFGWSCYLARPPGDASVSPYAAAARATDLAGLPSTFLSVGAIDLFLDESLDYARRLAQAGVPVELHVYPGAFHGFRSVEKAEVSIAAERDSRAALRRAFGLEPAS